MKYPSRNPSYITAHHEIISETSHIQILLPLAMNFHLEHTALRELELLKMFNQKLKLWYPTSHCLIAREPMLLYCPSVENLQSLSQRS